jgi:hypothetical protein
MIYTNTAEIIQDKKGNFRLKSGQEIYPEKYETRAEAIAAIKANIDGTIDTNKHFSVAGTRYNCRPEFTHYLDENGNEIAATDTVFYEEETGNTEIAPTAAAYFGA